MSNPTFTEGVLSSATAWTGTSTDLVNYITALGQMFETTFGIVNDVGDPDNPTSYTPGWSTLLNPTTCPTEFLPYLGQFIGANVQPGTPDAVARSQITNGSGRTRGTLSAMKWAAQQNLTGTQYLQVFERTSAGVAQITNEVYNPNFEYDQLNFAPAGWSVLNIPSGDSFSFQTALVQNDWASRGSQSLRLTMGTTAGADEILAMAGPAVSASPGQQWWITGKANVLSLVDTTTVVAGIAYSSGQAWVNLTTTGIQSLYENFIIPGGVTSIQPFIGFYTGTNVSNDAAGDAYFDTIQLTEGLTPYGYFDGDTPGYEWSGAKGNSPSTPNLTWNQADPYAMIFQFHSDECPSVQTLIAAVEALKPAGIQITYQSTNGYTWVSATKTWSQDAALNWVDTITVQP